jgi:hypothetical protein
MIALLADLLVVLHLVFIGFVLGGGLLVRRWPRLVWAHAPAAVWGTLVELAGWVCPLTPLEQALRQRAGESAYSDSFVEHYVVPIVYPTGLTTELQVAAGVVVVVVNLLVYGSMLRARRAARLP